MATVETPRRHDLSMAANWPDGPGYDLRCNPCGVVARRVTRERALELAQEHRDAMADKEAGRVVGWWQRTNAKLMAKRLHVDTTGWTAEQLEQWRKQQGPTNLKEGYEQWREQIREDSAAGAAPPDETPPA